jgi:uncharacterized membrane protein YfcA
MYYLDLLYLVPLLFIAGLIDGIAGGGGIIALPAYLLTGMPVHSAYACNKLQSGLGTSASAIKYIKDGYADIRITLCAIPFTIASSLLMTRLVIGIDGEVIKIIIAVCIPIAAGLMFLKRFLSPKTVKHQDLSFKTVGLSMLCGAMLGAYDALFGPGGGTIAMILFSILLSYDLRVGNGNGKIIIVASNFTAMLNYIVSGYMIWHVAIPCAIANIVGSYLGAAIVIKKGEKIVFPTMVLVIILLIGQVILNFVTAN